jgi:prevent-host-death family protein
MHPVGIKELKNRLTYYLKLTRKGDRIVITDRGIPIAVMHGLDQLEQEAPVEERLAVLAREGLIRLPKSAGGLKQISGIAAPGKPASEWVIEDRR